MGVLISPTLENPIPMTYVIVRQRQDGRGPLVQLKKGDGFGEGVTLQLKDRKAAVDVVFRIRDTQEIEAYRLGVCKLRQGIRRGIPSWLLSTQRDYDIEKSRRARKAR